MKPTPQFVSSSNKYRLHLTPLTINGMGGSSSRCVVPRTRRVHSITERHLRRVAAAPTHAYMLTPAERALLMGLLSATHCRSGTYSIAPTHPALAPLARRLHTDAEWAALAASLSAKVGHPVNYFHFVTASATRLPFLGFDYRRVAYEVDRLRGVNRVAAAVAAGHYG